MRWTRTIVIAALVTLMTACASLPPECVPKGTWVIPRDTGAQPIAASEVLAKASSGSIVLLGENHDDAAHHRWQRDTLEAIHAVRPNMIVGFEMFPRRVQTVLDQWSKGELAEADFLARVDWKNVWGFDPKLYLPLFDFVRERKLPMVALNVDRALVREVGKAGFDAVPVDKREGVTKPAAATPAYVNWLFDIYSKHQKPSAQNPAITRDDPRFRRFVDAQQTWDRAFAQALAQSAMHADKPLVVGVMGSGHVLRGFGVPHQLRDLGVRYASALIPWSRDGACKELVPGYADAVYGAW